MNARRVLTCLSTALLLHFAAHVSPAAETWRAGAAKAVITPPAPMWMAGFAARERPSEGKDHDLWAKALVLEDGAGRRAVLVTLDIVGIDRATSQSICGKLMERHQLRRDQIALNCSHTHSGPVIAQNLACLHYRLLPDDQRKLIDDYASLLEQRVLGVVDEAVKQLAPAAVSWGSGYTTFATNRRNNNQLEVPQIRARGELRGPVDHDVPVLAVRSPNGALRAVAFGYACHATVLSEFNWSGDYPGVAQIEMEKLHPDAVALFWAGCGGDQNPLPRGTQDQAQRYGQMLASAVDAVLAAPMPPIDQHLHTSYAEIDLPLGELPTREQIENDTRSDNKYTVSRATMLLEELDAGRSLPTTYPYPISLWKLGDDVQWVFLGGEVVVDYALRLKRELSGEATWVAGYTHDVMAYIPSLRVLKEGRYEGGGAMVYYGLPTSWAPEVEERIIAEVHRQAKSEQPR